MSRPTELVIDPVALIHNLEQIKRCAPRASIITMLKANAYGCGIDKVAPILDGRVDAFGVAYLSEALAIRALGCQSPCLLLEGVFSKEELIIAANEQFSCVIHQDLQLDWLVHTPLEEKVKIWVKVNTGMHRLGFSPHEVPAILSALQACPWVDKDIGLMTHFASADEAKNSANVRQMEVFESLDSTGFVMRSMANSAAIINFEQSHMDAVRPGIMLYGVSPLPHRTALELGLKPVMRFRSAITCIRDYPSHAAIGYSGTWYTNKPSKIGIVPVGYGDGYPRHIAANTPVLVGNEEVPIVGRVSMDMLTVDLTHYSGQVEIGMPVELWGEHLLVERIAQAAGTSPYELLCQVTQRPRAG